MKYHVTAVSLEIKIAPYLSNSSTDVVASALPLSAGLCFYTGGTAWAPSSDKLVTRSLPGSFQIFDRTKPYSFKRRYSLNQLNQILASYREAALDGNPTADERFAITVFNANGVTVPFLL